jgi:hypothetical protein
VRSANVGRELRFGLMTYQSAHDDLALSDWRRQADSRALSGSSDGPSVLLDSSNRGLGSSGLSSGAAAATGVGTAALAARLGDVLEGLVKFRGHFNSRIEERSRVENGACSCRLR